MRKLSRICAVAAIAASALFAAPASAATNDTTNNYGTPNPDGCWVEVAWGQIIPVPCHRPWYCGFWPGSCR